MNYNSTAEPGTIELIETETDTHLDKPWVVVVHNDPVNLMSYVAMTFKKVFGWNHEKSEQHMMEVHTKGRSILYSGGREKAELYVQQLHTFLLQTTMEQQ